MQDTISVCVICKNEQGALSRGLSEIRDRVEEIIVVDTGSTDGTRDIAAQYADKLLDFEWIDDFSAARNYSIARASGDWLLFLDADEIIFKKDMDELRELICEVRSRATRDTYGIILEGHEFLTDYEVTGKHKQIGWPKQPPLRIYKKLMLVSNTGSIRFRGRIHESLDFRHGPHHYLEPHIRCAHFPDCRRSRLKSQYYFELEKEALWREPENSNAHFNVLKTLLLRGQRTEFSTVVASLRYVEPRFRLHFERLSNEAVDAGWHEAKVFINSLLAAQPFRNV